MRRRRLGPVPDIDYVISSDFVRTFLMVGPPGPWVPTPRYGAQWDRELSPAERWAAEAVAEGALGLDLELLEARWRVERRDGSTGPGLTVAR